MKSVIFQGMAKSLLITLCLFIGVLPAASTAEPRNFYMALWSGMYNPDIGLRDVDLAWFHAQNTQPPGLSILQLNNVYDDPNYSSTANADKMESTLRASGYDWSRILAVVIDEPYWGRNNDANFAAPCYENAFDPRLNIMDTTSVLLIYAKEAVKRISSSTRFWVNFSEPEVQWMMRNGPDCTVQMLSLHFYDVVSLDKYDTPFARPGSNVKQYYDWFWRNRMPAQQLALVPIAFFSLWPGSTNPTDANVSATWLSGYFDYATEKNAGCTFDATKSAANREENTCPIWLVAGFYSGREPYHPYPCDPAEPSHPCTPQETWAFIYHDSAAPILAKWRTHLGVTARSKAAISSAREIITN